MSTSSTKRTLSEYESDKPKKSRSLSPGASRSQPKPRLVLESQNSPEPASEDNALRLRYPSLSQARFKQVPFQLPTQVLTFSYNENHELEFTNSAMRYYVDPPNRARLGYGYDRWIKRPDTRTRLDSLLKAMSRARAENRLGDVGLVTWRGIITKILTAPYEEREGWEMNVMYADGTLFLEEHLTESDLHRKNNMDSRQRQQTYYGYAFESYCTSDSPTQRPHLAGHPFGWGGDVNTNVQWCSVVRTKLGDLRMVLGGEVDCVRGRYTGQTDTFVELKTSLAIRGPPDAARFEKKLLKFYFQSFLLGVPEIVVGFRTPSGQLTTTQTFKTIEIPRLVGGKPGAWDPLLCLEWGQNFLAFLRNIVAKDEERDDGVPVWRVRFIPKDGVVVERLNRAGIEEVANSEDRVGFLPTWFWEAMARPGAPGNEPHIAQPPP